MNGRGPDPREQFTAIAARADADIDVAEAALWIAAEEYPDLDVGAYLSRLDALGSAAAQRTAAASDPVERITRLNHFLFREIGFHGNRDVYYDPRNSYLNDVLDRRSGIPISLSLVYVEVGRRAGLPLAGICFPGHFLVRSTENSEVVVDAFSGALLAPADVRERLAAAVGPTAELRPEIHLRPATSREILLRMLRNLKQIFLATGDAVRALACSERLLLLWPDEPLELRDRGLLYARLDCHAAAIADLEHFLEIAPADPSADAVRGQRDALRAKAPRRH